MAKVAKMGKIAKKTKVAQWKIQIRNQCCLEIGWIIKYCGFWKVLKIKIGKNAVSNFQKNWNSQKSVHDSETILQFQIPT